MAPIEEYTTGTALRLLPQARVAPVLELQYRGDAAHRPERRGVRAIFLLAAAPAAAAPFVPFVYDISPMFAVAEFFRLLLRDRWDSGLFLVLLAAPFFLGLPIVMWELRLLIAPRLRPLERVVMYACALTSALMSLTFFGACAYFAITDSWDDDLYRLLPCPTVLVAGVAAWWWFRRRCGAAIPESLPLLAMLLAYLVNGGMCLTGFYDSGRNTGWFAMLIACAGMTAELLAAAASTTGAGRVGHRHRV